MKCRFLIGLTLTLFAWNFITEAKSQETVAGPSEIVYTKRDTTVLHAYVFTPSPLPKEPIAAIAVLHGGGWHIGKPQWAFKTARHFAGLGMVGIAVEYRLSDQKVITPLDAMADTRCAIRWFRAHSDSLGIDPKRIAAYGWSAGAHLITSAAIFNKADSGNNVDCSPDALILESPAVSLIGDRWFRHLLLGRADVRDLSPDEHVREGLPPTLILQGDVDTVTPLAFTERFWRRMVNAGNRCEMQVYKGYGHLFTPMEIPDTGQPEPDPEIETDAMSRSDDFLRSLGFIRDKAK